MSAMEMTAWAWFLIGTVLGVGVGGCLWWVDSWLFRKHILVSAREGSPVVIDDRQFNVVPIAMFEKMRYVYMRVAATAQREKEKSDRYAEAMIRKDLERDAGLGIGAPTEPTPWGEPVRPGQ